MKTNEYLQKYGQKALQLLNKKSQKQTIVSDINLPSDNEHPGQLIEKAHKKSLLKNQKSHSNKSLRRNSKSKSKISINGNTNQNQYTFQKPLNLAGLPDKGKDRKKLMISGLSTPKNNRSARMVSNLQQKPQSSSTKKKATDVRISQKLNQALSKNKTPKSLIKQLMQCLDIISTHQYKITKWVSQFKQILYNIAEQATTYRRKYRQQVIKNKKLSKEIEQLHCSMKINGEKRKKTVEVVVMEENCKLRERVDKLEKKIQNYEKKQIILIETLEKLKIGTVKTGQQETNSSSKKEIGYASTKIKKQFYGNLEQDQQQQQEQQSEQEFRENQ